MWGRTRHNYHQQKKAEDESDMQERGGEHTTTTCTARKVSLHSCSSAAAEHARADTFQVLETAALLQSTQPALFHASTTRSTDAACSSDDSAFLDDIKYQ